MEVTILYYSSNRENPEFEEKIIQNLIKNSNGLPIVSVTQKPMNLGVNLCIGEMPHSYESEFKQIKAGLEFITTPYVLTAESDFLYPPEYFTFIPTERGNFYRYNNVWVCQNGEFRMKGASDGAQLVDRELWLKDVEERHKTDWTKTWGGSPAITFKTKNNVSKRTQTKSDIKPLTILPYWGDIKNYEQYTKK